MTMEMSKKEKNRLFERLGVVEQKIEYLSRSVVCIAKKIGLNKMDD